MFKIILKTYQISLTQKINMCIYYIRKIPFIKKLIPENIYNTTSSKIIVANILKVLLFLFGFAKKFVYMFLMIILPSILISKLTNINDTTIKFHIFFFLNFINGGFIDNKFNKDILVDFYMINLMRVNPKHYYLSNILFSYIEILIYFTLPIMLLGCSLLEAFLVTLELIAFRSIIQGCNLLFSYYGSSKLNNKWYNKVLTIIPIIIILISSFIAYGGPFIGIISDIKNLLFNIWFIILLLTLSITSIYCLINYKKYKLLAKQLLRKEDMNEINNITSDINFISVKLNDKNFKNVDLKIDNHKNKHGLIYLNSKFIERHKSIIIKPIIVRVIIISLLFIVSLAFTLYNSKFHSNIVNLIMESNGILVFVLYFISIGEKITKAFFFNCDKSLLRFKFYKEPKILLSNFKSRLKISILLNILPGFALGLALSIILYVAKGDIIKFIPIFISILSLSIFFSVHYLFLYYICQPYTTQLTIESPIYKIASFLVYIISYTCMKIKNDSIWFTLLIILVTILYTVISLTLVYKFSPKTFKLNS